MRLVDGEVGFLCNGPVEDSELPDLRIIMDSTTLRGIVEKTIDPVNAYNNDRIRIKGSILDKLLLKTVLSS